MKLDIWPCFCGINAPVWFDGGGCNSQWALKVFVRGFWWHFSCASSLNTVIPKCAYSQKTMTWIRCDCEVRSASLWSDGVCEGLVKRHDLIWMSDCTSIHSIWNFAGNVFMSGENGVTNWKVSGDAKFTTLVNRVCILVPAYQNRVQMYH